MKSKVRQTSIKKCKNTFFFPHIKPLIIRIFAMHKNIVHQPTKTMDTTCKCCPRRCQADRREVFGVCRAPQTPEVSSICCHRGEEPPISGHRGICNLFFSHCNLQCIFCQNHDISRAVVDSTLIHYNTIESIVERILTVLPQCENMLGLVSPTHYAHLIPDLIESLHCRQCYPTVVYNSNGYDDPEMLRQIAPYVDIYLPDYKYSDSQLAAQLSQAPDYPKQAAAALKEMCYQKGHSLRIDEEGLAFGGIIIRHLILPGQVDNSLHCLDWIAENLSPNIHVSLMSQYYPPSSTLPMQLSRRVTQEEYETVVNHFYQLGFTKGWVQELSSAECFHPNFRRQDSFQSNTK